MIARKEYDGPKQVCIHFPKCQAAPGGIQDYIKKNHCYQKQVNCSDADFHKHMRYAKLALDEIKKTIAQPSRLVAKVKQTAIKTIEHFVNRTGVF